MTSPPGVSLCGAATVFVVQDVVRSVEHYRDVLGFQTEFTYGQPTFYAGVERDGVIIHLQAASETERRPGHGAVNIFVTAVDASYRELKSRGARTLKEPKDYPYGMRDFDIEDPDGNHLCCEMESKEARTTPEVDGPERQRPPHAPAPGQRSTPMFDAPLMTLRDGDGDGRAHV